MSENQKNTSEIWATPESNQDILARQSASVQKIIEEDPILSKNLDQITNPKEFFEKLAQNAHIFKQTDNLAAQKTFLEQSLKGLGYWQYIKDGREFGKLSDDEVGKLDIREKIAYKKWSIEHEKQKTIKTAQAADKEGEKVISEEQRLTENREKVIKTAQAADKEGEKVIELKEKNTKAWEENQKITDTLSINWKSLIDSEFQKARTDEKNPVYQDLVSKGVDPSKGEFDNILRASIILANVDALRKESSDQSKFENSIRELGKIGILYPVTSDIPSISAHIDSRFPKWESTERAKWEITRSIESGNVANLYYDGKWEKYTIIDKDGKTSKEVYMNPPRIRVIQNGFEAEEKIVPSEDTKRRIEKQDELRDIKWNTQEKIGQIRTDIYQVFRKQLPPENTEEYLKLLDNPVFRENFPTLQDNNKPIKERVESTDNLIKAYREARDTPTINKDLYDNKIRELTVVRWRLQEEQRAQSVIANIPITSSEEFENNIKANFTTLTTEPRLYNRFHRKQELLTGVIEAINNKNPQNPIQLGEKALDQSGKKRIDEEYKKIFDYLGTDNGILKSADIGTIKPKINELLQGNGEGLRKLLWN
jgi:hypothetical protein